MSNGRLAEYFEKHRYKPKWQLGDRVFGKYNGIPFIGSIGNDTVIDEDIGPRVTIHIDLPIIENDIRKTVIVVKPNEIKRLKEYE